MNATRPIPELREAWREHHLADRVRKLRRAAQSARESFVAEGEVLALVTCPIATFPYPTLYAFQGGATSPAPFVMMTNRMMVVQYEDHDGERRTLLFNPSDDERADKAPFYAKLRKRYGGALTEKVLAKRHRHVPQHLEELGISPADVDFIAYDHLHLQDVRRWLGSHDEVALFPTAKLLVMPGEWATARDPHPTQAPGDIPGLTDGVEDSRVVFLEVYTSLGRGVALLDTRGHTLGNMSIALNTPDGVYVSSENGVSAECYSPEVSEIRGLKRYARQLDQEVILNGNTRESTPDQYASMLVEKTFAGPNRKHPEFCNFYPSSELTASVVAPGLSPSFSHGELRVGEVVRSASWRSGSTRSARRALSPRANTTMPSTSTGRR